MRVRKLWRAAWNAFMATVAPDKLLSQRENAMFGNYETYAVTMLEQVGGTRDLAEVQYGNCVVQNFEWPVVEFEHFGKKLIINLTSPRFVKAEKL